MRPIPAILIAFLRREEGVRHAAYRDTKGIWTCGVGSTVGVTPSTMWSDAQVDAHLRMDLDIAQSRVNNVLGSKVVDGLNDYQYAALLSFVFNVGAKPTWPIWGSIKSGRFQDVPSHLQGYDHADGIVVPGLQNRRKAECALWNGSDSLCKSFPLNPH